MISSQDNKYRELFLWALVFFILLTLPVKLIFFQKNDFILGKEFSEKASSRKSILNSKRGSIFDRNNLFLAEDIPSYEIGLTINNFSFDPKHIALLSENLGLNIERLKKRLSNKKAKYIVLSQNVSKDKKENLKKLSIPGLEISTRKFKRYYPQGEIFSQVIGLTNYKNEGINGMEFALEETLSATNGYQKKQLSRKSGIIQSEIIKEPIDGSNIRLTIDSKVQFVLFDSLKSCLLYTSPSPRD